MTVVNSIADRHEHDLLKSAAARQTVENWLARFEAFLAGKNDGHDLFAGDAAWRDALAFTWTIRTTSGGGAVRETLSRLQPATGAQGFRVAHTPPPQIKTRAGKQTIEAFFDFQTRFGIGRGVVRIAPGNETSPRAWSLMTALLNLNGFEEPVGPSRPRAGIYSHSFGTANWLEQWQERAKFEDRDPEVLIVGAGHAGLMLATHLVHLGVDALVIDRQKRTGDNWRCRYKSLTLHNEAWVCQLPFMPYPENWPVYLPKDMVADWLETYARAMQLNVWNETEFVKAAFDETAGCWSVTISAAGKQRTLRPKHLVLATGLSGAPKAPALPGLENFAGTVEHTSGYQNGARWKGKPAIVVGTGNSAHDVAQDLYSYGAQVTMIQRGSTTITSVEPSAQLVFALYSEGPTVDDCDLLAVSMTYDIMHTGQKILARKMADLDADLTAGLARAGFRTDIGEDESGYYMKYLRTGGGYYLNVGCSELIVDGKIRVQNAADIEKFCAEGLRLKDGKMIPAELVVLATGYENMQETTRRFLGAAVADKVGPVWGFDEKGDARNVWKQTAQKNLWYMAGSFAQCRTYSRYVAIQIKALETGLIASS